MDWLFVGFLIGVVVGYFLSERCGCKHEWGKWQKWGVTYQSKTCKKCGKEKLISI